MHMCCRHHLLVGRTRLHIHGHDGVGARGLQVELVAAHAAVRHAAADHLQTQAAAGQTHADPHAQLCSRPYQQRSCRQTCCTRVFIRTGCADALHAVPCTAAQRSRCMHAAGCVHTYLVHVLQGGRGHFCQLRHVEALPRVPTHRQLRAVVVADEVVQPLVVDLAVAGPAQLMTAFGDSMTVAEQIAQFLLVGSRWLALRIWRRLPQLWSVSVPHSRSLCKTACIMEIESCKFLSECRSECTQQLLPECTVSSGMGVRQHSRT